MEAAEHAGIQEEQVELIDEPVAALIDLLNAPTATTLLGAAPKKIALYDYGGGTLDITIVSSSTSSCPAEPRKAVLIPTSP